VSSSSSTPLVNWRHDGGHGHGGANAYSNANAYAVVGALLVLVERVARRRIHWVTQALPSIPLYCLRSRSVNFVYRHLGGSELTMPSSFAKEVEELRGCSKRLRVEFQNCFVNISREYRDFRSTY